MAGSGTDGGREGVAAATVAARALALKAQAGAVRSATAAPQRRCYGNNGGCLYLLRRALARHHRHGMATLYRTIAEHYLGAITAGTLRPGDRFPSVRALMSTHGVSLSTALSACRHLEDGGWLQARPRAGYFVQMPRRGQLPPARENAREALPDAAAYVGIHERVSRLLARSEAAPVHINLALAVGAPELYPTEALQRIMRRQLREQPKILGTMLRHHGHPALRTALAQRALARGMRAAPHEVLVTHGCIEALNLALRAVTQPGDTVAVESPTFYGVLQVLECLGLRALELPTSPSTGLSLDALEWVLRDGLGDVGAAGTPGGVKAVVAMPTLHNPLGCVMPEAHKERLVRLCAAHGVALIEDDIYGEMGSDDTPYKPAKAFDTTGHVIYCASLNKSLAPGLRLGWMLGGRWQARIEMLKYAQSRFGETLPQSVVAEFLASPAHERHLRLFRQTLRRQREQMAECVAACFPAGTRLTLPEGGMLLWLQLPEGVAADTVFEQALAQGIKLIPGSMFSNGPRFQDCLRLSCGQPHGPRVEQALGRVGDIIARLA
jgi:DNA-binding transcriptional MocR family regulator